MKLLPSVPDWQLTPNRTFRVVYGRELTGDVAVWPESGEAIREGYGCGNCLKYFDGLYTPLCPACGARTGSEQITQPWWTSEKVF